MESWQQKSALFTSQLTMPAMQTKTKAFEDDGSNWLVSGTRTGGHLRCARTFECKSSADLLKCVFVAVMRC